MIYFFDGVQSALEDIDYEKSVLHLKEEIARKLQNEAKNLELVYRGNRLDDEEILSKVVNPSAIIHCFLKTKEYIPYVPRASYTDAESITRVQELFNVIAHIQMNVTSRVNVLQKILAEYPEFRRNLGAQALIRDSVLFNTLHQPEVIKSIATNYPIICEAAPFIVDVVKKELIRGSSTRIAEPSTDSTNSSEEENSLGASSSSDRGGTETGNTEDGRTRVFTRQQLQTALAQIGFGSVNSLANIAQQQQGNSEATSASSATGTGTETSNNPSGGERINSEYFRNELQRVFEMFNPRSESGSTDTPQQMDTDTPADSSTNTTEDNSCSVPSIYRSHQYFEQLKTLSEMGFRNYAQNVIYLNTTNGNIETTINLLMGNMD